MIKLPARLASLALAALSAACGGSGDGGSGEVAALLATPRTIALEPVKESGVNATLTITPQDSETADGSSGQLDTAMSADGLDPRFVYPVHLRSGSCGSDRGVLAQLVSLTPDDEGRATSSTSIDVEFIGDARSLFAQISGPDGDALACGDL